ncbi:MAG TPA: UDP-3-O-(3-hydroxymyristoyl)glucosamine N-acyltransferase [Caulobacteraceae bacterium]|nr:UDP-3-O-(3-hydroxymyristoyl)glucosamine N-acyltransferase [Caulobacteraceae bacterium]
MPDSRFFEDLGPVGVDELVEITGATLASGPARDRSSFSSVAPLAEADADAVGFFSDARHLDALKTTRAGACFIAPAQAALAPAGCTVLLTSEPKIAYAKAALRLYRPRLAEAGDQRVHPTAALEDGVVLEPGAVVGAGASIGARTHVGANAVIGPGVAIGRDCVIGSNVTIGFALIGDRVRILAGAVIGEAGFGVGASRGAAIDLPQLGRVILQDGVTVGANSCIDRGAWEDTVVGENTKIDNLVQIGHNVQLGRSCVLCGSVGLSGSTIVGDGVMFGAKAGIADHVTIGAGAQVMAAAGVMSDIPAGETWGGAPAVRARQFWRQVAWVSRMTNARSRRAEG